MGVLAEYTEMETSVKRLCLPLKKSNVRTKAITVLAVHSKSSRKWMAFSHYIFLLITQEQSCDPHSNNLCKAGAEL